MKRFEKLLIALSGLALSVGAAVGVGLGVDKNASEAKASTVKVYGINGDWSEGAAISMSDGDEDGVYTCNYTIPASSNKTFKVVCDGGWYGYSNILAVKPENQGVWSTWSDGGESGHDDNVGMWSKTSINLTIGFRVSDNKIFIANQGNLSKFKTFYFVLPNTGNDKDSGAWTSWGTPKVHFWSNSYETKWAANPYAMTNVDYTYTHGDTTGNLYSFNVPQDCNILIRDNGGTKQTEDYTLSSSLNMIHPYVNSNKNMLYADNTTPTFIANGAYLRGDWGNNNYGWTLDGQKPMSGTGPYTVSNVALGAGGKVKMVIMNKGVETWCQPNSVSGTQAFPASKVAIDPENPYTQYNVQVTKVGIYSITVTKNGDDYDYVFSGADDPNFTAAISFATTFVSDIYSNCAYNYSTGNYNQGKSDATVRSTWTTKISDYSALDGEVKKYLSTDAGSTSSEITTMWDVYDYVYDNVSGVSDIAGADFLGRAAQAGSRVGIANNDTQLLNNNSTLITVIASTMVTLIAVGGYFFLRRKADR